MVMSQGSFDGENRRLKQRNGFDRGWNNGRMAKFFHSPPSRLEWLLCVQYLSRSHRNGMVGERREAGEVAGCCTNIIDEQLSDEQNKLRKDFIFAKNNANG